MRVTLIILALAVAAPATAQSAAPERVDIALSNFKFTPKTIRLHHGRAYQLHFTNAAGGGHDFVAKTFFAAAGGTVKDGEVSLDGHGTADVRITAPAAGHYPVHCSHFMHSTFGMTGEIVVD